VGRYAHRKGYPLESVEVKTSYDVGFDRVDGPMHSRAYLSQFRCEVELKGPLTAQQFEELKWIADNCPMGNTLRRSAPIDQRVTLVSGKSSPERKVD